MARGSRHPTAHEAFDCADSGYRAWRVEEVVSRGRTLRMATKPGLLSAAELDPAAALLLDHLEVGVADRVDVLNSGSGVVGALAALAAPGGRVRLADRSLVAVEASRRTLAANGAEGAEVHLSQGLAHLGGATSDAVVVRLPQGKVPALQLLWDAHRLLRPGGRCWIAGGNDEGIRTALRQMEELFGSSTLLAYRGGHRVGVGVRGEAGPPASPEPAARWVEADSFHELTIETRGGAYEIRSRPGVFSWERFDRGSQALVEAMEVRPGDGVLDLGCGYGIVGLAAARLEPTARVTMLDVDVEAVRSAARSAEANGLADRCEALVSDVAGAVRERRFDLVVANPPFHVGKATDLDVPAQFIRDAAAVLRPGGRLLLVANRTLPYERWIEACFGAYRSVVDGREFKVLGAVLGNSHALNE